MLALPGHTEIPQGFIYDYKQLEFFHVNPDKIGSKGTVVNEPYWEKYKLLFILLYPSILALLIASIVWLMRVNRREAKRRVQAQTRLLVQNKMVEQRNEFDNVFHSIRDGVITYDTDLGSGKLPLWCPPQPSHRLHIRSAHSA